MDTIDDLLTRGVENIIPDRKSLDGLLRTGKKLNIYIGIDPTAPAIHLGHAFPLRKLQLFSDLGHHVHFLIGDFTALIGDTSDKESERPVLTSEQIEQNFRTYKSQAEKFLDFSKVHVVHNSEWLSKLSFRDIVELTHHFSAGDFFGRELIKKRLNDGKHVGLHEVLYPVMQGYDSYFMDTDIQLGGTDQTFNMQAGRILQKDLRGKQSYVIANGFLTGTDGRKMSKTWNNAIWLSDPPDEVYGKVMSLSDALIEQYFLLGTGVSQEEISGYMETLENGENPMNIKKILAHVIASELHGEDAAHETQKRFEEKFQQRDLLSIDHQTVTYTDGVSVFDILQMDPFNFSSSETRRQIAAGSIEVNQLKITPETMKMAVKNGDIIKQGKRKTIKISIPVSSK